MALWGERLEQYRYDLSLFLSSGGDRVDESGGEGNALVKAWDLDER